MKIGKAQSAKPQSGFTLLEMLLVIGLIGVLAAIGVARYETHIASSNRQAARAALLLAQQSMERQRLQNGSFVNAIVPAAQPDDPFVIGLADLTPTTYTLQATPRVADADCGTLTINQAGVRGATGPVGAVACWQ